MRRDSNIARRLNNGLGRTGVGTDLSLTKLLLHHVDNRIISERNIECLRENEARARDIYDKNIFPKVEKLFKNMSHYRLGFPRGDKCLIRFGKRAPEAIRRKLKDSYDGQFGLDDITAAALYSTEKMPYAYATGSEHCFNKYSKHIISRRHKEKGEEARKFATNFEKLDGDERIRFYNFIAEFAEAGYRSAESHKYFLEKFGKKITDMMVDDFYGVKFVDMNQGRFETNAERLVDRGTVDLKDFHSIEVKDHRNRNRDSRPGGLHCIFTDKAYLGFPVEVQFRGIKDEVYNLIGKHASWKYAASGKKDVAAYDD